MSHRRSLSCFLRLMLLAAALVSSAESARAQVEDCIDALNAPILLDVENVAVINGNFTGSFNDGPNRGCGGTSHLTQWFVFSPPVSGVYNFSLCGSAQIDTHLAIFDNALPCEDPAVPNPPIPNVACNDDACGEASQAVVNLQLGITYRIRVAAINAVTNGGGYSLAVQLQTATFPDNDGCNAPTTLPLATAVEGTSRGAIGGFNFTSCGGNNDTNDIYYSFIPSNSKRHVVSVCSSWFDATLSVHAPCPLNGVITNEVPGRCASSLDSASLCAGRGASINTQMTAGIEYILRVAGTSDNSGAPLPGFGPLALAIVEVPYDPPVNDDCPSAIDFSAQSLPFTSVVEARGAFNDIDPGSCNSSQVPEANYGVWYSYTAPSDGLLRVTESSASDVAVALWQAPACPTLVGADRCVDSPEDFTHFVTAGQRYFILVSSTFPSGPTSQFTTTFQFYPPPSNDSCETALDITNESFPLPFAINAQNAQPDAVAPVPGCFSLSTVSAGVWFRFRAPATGGRLSFSETRSDNDVVWVVYTGPCDARTLVQCFAADNSVSNFIDVVPDQTYTIGLWRQTSGIPTGLYTGSFNFKAPPTNEDCEHAITVTDSFAVDNTLAVTDPANQNISCASQIVTLYRDTWFRYVVPAKGELFTFFEEGFGSAVARVAIYKTPTCPSGQGQLLTCAQGANFQRFPVEQGDSLVFQIGSNIATGSAIGTMRLILTPAVGRCCLPMDQCGIGTQAACEAIAGARFEGERSVCLDTLPTLSTFSAAGAFIPDGLLAGVSIPIIVTPAFVVGDVEVDLNLTHSYTGDLSISLSKDGRSCTLVSRTSRGLNNSVDGSFNDLSGAYRFDDDAPTSWWPLAGNDPVLPGVYHPSDEGDVFTSLRTTFNGALSAGTWTLTIIDHATPDSGVLSSWSLRLFRAGEPLCITPCQGDFDNDGVVAVADIFTFLSTWFSQFNTCAGPACSADIDDNGVVDVADIFAFLNQWFVGFGSPCP